MASEGDRGGSEGESGPSSSQAGNAAESYGGGGFGGSGSGVDIGKFGMDFGYTDYAGRFDTGYGGYGSQGPSTFAKVMATIGNFALTALKSIAATAIDAALAPFAALNFGQAKFTGQTAGQFAVNKIAGLISQQGMSPKDAIAEVAKDPALGLPEDARQTLLDNADKIGTSIESDFSSAIANYNGDMNEGGVRYGPEQYAYADSIKTSDPEGYASLVAEMNRVQGGGATPDFSSLEGKYTGGAKVQAPAQADPLGGMAQQGGGYTDQLQNVLGGRGANTVAQGQRFDEFGRMQTGRDRAKPMNNRVSTKEEDIPKDWSEFVQFSAKRNRQQRADQSLIPQQNNAMMLGQEQQPFQGFDFSGGK